MTTQITEQSLKDRCTSELIKRMCELAEGFEYQEENEHDVDYFIWNNKKYFTSSDVLFPLLIHRAVEGWNKIDKENQIRIDGDEAYIPTWELGESSCKYFKKATDYLPQSLTACECAMLHCLLDIFKEERK